MAGEGGPNVLYESPIKWATNAWFEREAMERLDANILIRVHLTADLDEVFDILQKWRSLQDIVIMAGLPWSETTESNIQNLHSYAYIPQLPWKILTYFIGRTEFVVTIMTRLTKLVTLNIGVTQELFIRLLPLLFHLEELSIVALSLREHWLQFEPPRISHPSATSKELTIMATGDIRKANGPLSSSLFLCFPNIHSLRLHTLQSSTIRMLISISGFRHVNAALISGRWSSDDTVPEGNVESLLYTVESLTCSVPDQYWRSLMPLHSKHMKYLDLSHIFSYEVDLGSRSWPELHTLRLGGGITIKWGGPKYHFLRFISVTGGIQTSHDGGARSATRICREIALHPNWFPALEVLAFQICPEWDILCILLESRNVATRPDISPIITLTIPTRCPPFLVECFRDLLRGNCLNHSHYEISLTAALQICRDLSLWVISPPRHCHL